MIYTIYADIIDLIQMNPNEILQRLHRLNPQSKQTQQFKQLVLSMQSYQQSLAKSHLRFESKLQEVEDSYKNVTSFQKNEEKEAVGKLMKLEQLLKGVLLKYEEKGKKAELELLNMQNQWLQKIRLKPQHARQKQNNQVQTYKSIIANLDAMAQGLQREHSLSLQAYQRVRRGIQSKAIGIAQTVTICTEQLLSKHQDLLMQCDLMQQEMREQLSLQNTKRQEKRHRVRQSIIQLLDTVKYNQTGWPVSYNNMFCLQNSSHS